MDAGRAHGRTISNGWVIKRLCMISWVDDCLIMECQ